MSSESRSPSPSPNTPSPDFTLSSISIVDADQQLHSNPWLSSLDNFKSEAHMLNLDDLIEQHAYEDATPAVTTFRSSMPAGIKPIPPPAVPPRKAECSPRRTKVVHPPKESCFNLPIMFPSLPPGGTKSRVETQVRVTVDLADPSSSTDPNVYDRVGTWKWLKLPPGTATKKRTRKQGKIDPDPQDMLYLTVAVSCATSPYNRVLSCSSCQAREAKRVAKKIAARVRPARNSDSEPEDPGAAKTPEDSNNIIQFNCAQIVDFSTGSAVLPLRITCYCRHHREKTGFTVNFTMMDSTGRTVGVGSSSPIMITDDHKTTAPKHADLQPYDWTSASGSSSPAPEIQAPAPSKRKTDAVKKRIKPYDSAAKPNRDKGSRETSVVSSAPSPSTSVPTPPPPPAELLPSLQYVSQESDSSPDVLTTPPDMNFDIPMLPEGTNFDQLFSNSPSAPPVTSLPFLFTPSDLPLSMPTIHRLIPNCGPTHGGIEVTVLGANFHPTIQFNCVFGGARASSTQRWSDNTLVCILPPRATAGMVEVWFEGFPPKAKEQPPSFFTYSDESDRALMELALQVVGLKMTGQLEDAKNVAMRIVGAGEGTESLNSHSGQGSGIQLSSSARDLRSLMLLRAGTSEDFQSLIANFLKLIDMPIEHPSAQVVPISNALMHTTKSGQSLLHLAAFLGYGAIVEFLIQHGIDLDMRDRNGLTALHFAAMGGSRECVMKLLRAGADYEIVDALGKTPEEVGSGKDIRFDDILEEMSNLSMEPLEDEEAEWGDAEEESEEESVMNRRVKTDRRVRRSRVASRKASLEELEHHRTITPKTSSANVSVAPDTNPKEKEAEAAADEKQALSFIDMLQRTMAQLQLPGAPYLPLPQFPLLPGVPAVPWETLHQLNPIQIPMIFPVAVPLLPGWMSGEHREGAQDQDGADGADSENGGKFVGPFKAAQEWRAIWEKWVAHMPTWQQATEMPPPPQYTPRASTQEVEAPSHTPSTSSQQQQLVRRVSSSPEESEVPLPAPASGSASRSTRRYDYNSIPVTDQEVNAYAYQPKPQQKKHDRMLLLFWLPILMISLLWACHSGMQFVIRALETPMAFKKVLGFN